MAKKTLTETERQKRIRQRQLAYNKRRREQRAADHREPLKPQRSKLVSRETTWSRPKTIFDLKTAKREVAAERPSGCTRMVAALIALLTGSLVLNVALLIWK